MKSIVMSEKAVDFVQFNDKFELYGERLLQLKARLVCQNGREILNDVELVFLHQ